MKRLFLKNSVLIFFLIIFFLQGCFKNDSYENVKEEYLKNKDNIKEIVKTFNELPAQISTIARSDESWTNYISCNFTKKNIRYSVVTKKDGVFYHFRLIIEGDEEDFWKQDYTKIKNKEGVTLSSFLKDYNIPESSFKKIRNFLYDNDYISLHTEGATTLISFSHDAGIAYTQSNTETKIYGDISEFKRIDSHAYYFLDTNFP